MVYGGLNWTELWRIFPFILEKYIVKYNFIVEKIQIIRTAKSIIIPSRDNITFGLYLSLFQCLLLPVCLCLQNKNTLCILLFLLKDVLWPFFHPVRKMGGSCVWSWLIIGGWTLGWPVACVIGRTMTSYGTRCTGMSRQLLQNPSAC